MRSVTSSTTTRMLESTKMPPPRCASLSATSVARTSGRLSCANSPPPRAARHVSTLELTTCRPDEPLA